MVNNIGDRIMLPEKVVISKKKGHQHELIHVAVVPRNLYSSVVLKLLKKFYFAAPFQFFQPLSVPCKFKHKSWLSCKDIYHKILCVLGKQLFILKKKSKYLSTILQASLMGWVPLLVFQQFLYVGQCVG